MGPAVRRLGGGLLIAALLAGCSPTEDWPPAFPRSIYTFKQLGQGEEKAFEPLPELQEKIDAFLVDQFGTPAEPKIKGATDDRNFAIHKGSRLFRIHCMYCHGPAGGGNGASAAAYSPLPRDYRRGDFKWKSTPGPQRPLREDLLRTVTNGIAGTSMPAFGRLAQEQREQLVEYVIFLSQRGETERRLLIKALTVEPGDLKDYLKDDLPQELKDAARKVADAWKDAKAVQTPARNESIDADSKLRDLSILRGRDLYMSPTANCVKCHGPDGKGRRQVLPNVAVTDDKDVWGNQVSPRDLTEGVYRGGRRMEDTFLRIQQGILASGMPAFGGAPTNLKAEDIWDLVRFVRALPYKPELLPGGKAQPEPPPGFSAAQR